MEERRNGMNGATKVLLGILAVIVIIVGFFILKYNGLVREDENVKTQYSNISVQLQRRNDLIPNLVNTVKGYAAHETEVFQAVSDARERMMGADTINEGVAADNELSQALGRLLAVAEAYPELKANENFLSLQDQLEGTENRISTARRDYNEAAKSFNTKLRSFPNNIIGGMFGFEKHDLFEAQPGAEIAPEVDFES